MYFSQKFRFGALVLFKFLSGGGALAAQISESLERILLVWGKVPHPWDLAHILCDEAFPEA